MRPRLASAAACAVLVGLAGSPALAAVPAAAPAPVVASAVVDSAVVVQTTGDRASAAQAVRRLGGTVRVDLPVVDGFSATLPTAALPALRTTPGVRAVTPDAQVHVQGTTSGTADSTLKSVYAQEVGATALQAAGTTGKGVRVALVDTGVTPGPDLAGRVVPVQDAFQKFPSLLTGTRRSTDCVDLSGDGDCVDRYGHGTFLAGLIAGDGTASGGRFTGVAPGAEIVSVKLAGADGSADVTKVLAAIQWVVSFKDTYRIRVMNLSLGTDSTAPYWVDPLNAAVERAWKAGIVVVVAASNRGPAAGTISKPADDPYVVTVGAVDDRETPATDDDRVPAFSGRGPTAQGLAKPDVVAPGGRLVSLRSPGSTIERLAPGGVDATYRRGSGTSMATAVVSGLVAQLLQAQPAWTPDRVKAALVSTATDVNTVDRSRVGAGLVQGPAALAAAPGLANQGVYAPAQGDGTLDASRAGVLVQHRPCSDPCSPTTGQVTEQGRAYDPSAYTGTDWTGNSWYSSQWVGLSGNSWYGNSWYGNSWYGNSWYGDSYGQDPSRTPYGVPLPGSAWYGAFE